MHNSNRRNDTNARKILIYLFGNSFYRCNAGAVQVVVVLTGFYKQVVLNILLHLFSRRNEVVIPPVHFVLPSGPSCVYGNNRSYVTYAQRGEMAFRYSLLQWFGTYYSKRWGKLSIDNDWRLNLNILNISIINRWIWIARSIKNMWSFICLSDNVDEHTAALLTWYAWAELVWELSDEVVVNPIFEWPQQHYRARVAHSYLLHSFVWYHVQLVTWSAYRMGGVHHYAMLL